jgi:glucokinase
MDIFSDSRYVMTLDAGGTNFVFSAVKSGDYSVEPFNQKAVTDNIERCIKSIIYGFNKIKSKLKEKPYAISFAFPGPADYKNGIIGDLGNLPAFRGGVPLGPILEEHFGIPVFINNDGDLFAYGESIAGFLPELNRELEKAGNPKRYRNLFGITLGTGFGGGFVNNGEMYVGDNSAGMEIWLMRNGIYSNTFAEEGASIRAIKRSYLKYSKNGEDDNSTPREIYDIAIGKLQGDKNAAIKAYREFGLVIGDALANAITLLDCPVVIGGGLSAAAPLFMPKLIEQMNNTINTYSGIPVQRMESRAFNFDDLKDRKIIITGDPKELEVTGSINKIFYDPTKRIPIAITKLGTSKAVSIGAYAFALNELDKAKE